MKKIILSIALLSSLSLFGVSFLLKNSTGDIFNTDFEAPSWDCNDLLPAEGLKPAYQYQTIQVNEEDRTQSGKLILTFKHFEKIAESPGPFNPFDYEKEGNKVTIPVTRIPEENEKFEIIKNQDAAEQKFIIKPFEPSLQEQANVSFLLKNSTDDIFNTNLEARKDLLPEQMLKPAYQYQTIQVSEEDRTQSGKLILTFKHFEKIAESPGPFNPLDYESEENEVTIPVTRIPEENEKFKIIKNQDPQGPKFIIKPVFEPSLQERIAQRYREDPSLEEEAKQLPALMQVQLRIGYGAEGKTVEEIEQLQQAEK